MRTFRSILSIHAEEKGLKHLPKLEIFSSTAQSLSRERLAAEREKNKDLNPLWDIYSHLRKLQLPYLSGLRSQMK